MMWKFKAKIEAQKEVAAGGFEPPTKGL